MLIAVVIGLAIGDQALSLHRLLQARSRVKWDWVSPLAAVLILTELFNFWWQWRGFTGSTLVDVAPYFLALILLFLLAAITLPDEVGEDGVDLGGYFDSNRSYFWMLYGSYLTLYISFWCFAGSAPDSRRKKSGTTIISTSLHADLFRDEPGEAALDQRSGDDRDPWLDGLGLRMVDPSAGLLGLGPRSDIGP